MTSRQRSAGTFKRVESFRYKNALTRAINPRSIIRTREKKKTNISHRIKIIGFPSASDHVSIACDSCQLITRIIKTFLHWHEHPSLSGLASIFFPEDANSLIPVFTIFHAFLSFAEFRGINERQAPVAVQ